MGLLTVLKNETSSCSDPPSASAIVLYVNLMMMIWNIAFNCTLFGVSKDTIHFLTFLGKGFFVLHSVISKKFFLNILFEQHHNVP